MMETGIPMLMPTGDKTDRRRDIESSLASFGFCVLGGGEFYVSGVEMPEGTSLFGMGDASRVVLMEHVLTGCAVKMGNRCTVKNLSLFGGMENLPEEISPEAVGTRHGIGFLGDAVKKEDCARQIKDGIVSACRIEGFSGGGIHLRDTGYSVSCSLCASDLRIGGCGAGIYISHFSEYHKFSNVVCTRNLYGCINNGGNNVFSACSFDGNREGFLIDNSHGLSKNNAHGSAVGCTFNHTDHNTGVGVRILGSAPGFVFSGGQMYYSNIVVEKSQGIQFDHFNFGKKGVVTVRGGGAVAFHGCLFSSAPTFDVEENETVLCHECYTKGGSPISVKGNQES